MKLQEQLKSSAALPAVAGGSVDASQDDVAQAAPQFVNEHVISRVLGVPVKTLRKLARKWQGAAVLQVQRVRPLRDPYRNSLGA